MASTPLVDRYILAGETLLRQLDADGFEVSAAYWYHQAEQDNWQLIVESDLVAKEGRLEAYRKLLKSMSHLEEGTRTELSSDSSRVRLVALGYRLTTLIRRMVKTVRGISGIWLSANTVDGTFVDDAYVYRMEHRRKQLAH